MKLAISNLAFPSDLTVSEWASLSRAGVQGIEVAPTRIAAWDALSDDVLIAFRQRLGEAGLSVSSLQAIFFGVPGLQLLGSETEFRAMADHMQRISSVATTLGAGVVVFGAPKQRTKGDLPDDDAFSLGVERLASLADICAGFGVVIGLEPVPAAYAGDFLPTWQDVDRMVRVVENPSLKVHLDTGCVLLGGGDIAEAVAATAGSLAHFHIAEPKLSDFSAPQSDHAGAADALRRIDYDKWLSIEMMAMPNDALDHALAAVDFVRETYGLGHMPGI